MGCIFKLVVFLFVIRFSSCSTTKRQRRGTGPTVIPLTDREKMEIVNHHNDLRRLSGSSNMRFMTWDSELAWLAQEYSKKCHFAHNKERKHSRGLSVGENIFATSGKMLGSDITKAVQAWYDEIKYFSYNTRTCVPGKMCGHYTQVVWATTYKVGCALLSCQHLTGVNWNSGGSMFLCNYATAGNIVYGPTRKLMTIFEKGAACSKCDEDDYCRDYLCANSDRDFIEEHDSTQDETQNQSGEGAFIAVIIILGVIVVFLITLLIFRERGRSPNKFGLWKTQPNKPTVFSNQNTPVPSAYNTPRHSFAGTNLHGIQQRLTAADIGTPLEKFKAGERQTSSAPTTPRRTYTKGTATPPKAPPPVRPPPSQKK